MSRSAGRLGAGLVAAALLALAACADRTPGRFAPAIAGEPLADFVVVRSWLTLLTCGQWALMVYSSHKLGDKQRFAGLVGMPVLLLLSFTKLGEWLFRLYAWILGWGGFGQGLLVFASFVGGFNGFGTPQMLILAGFLYPHPELLQLCVVPGLVTSVGVNLQKFREARGEGA